MKPRIFLKRAFTTLGAAALVSAATAQDLERSSFCGSGVSGSASYVTTGSFHPTAGRPSITGNSDCVHSGLFAGMFLPSVEGNPTVYLVPTSAGTATLMAVPDLPGWFWSQSADAAWWSPMPDPSANPVLVPLGDPHKFFRLQQP
jgi:hypothetical protein